MTIGINTSPLAGQDGTKLTARLVKSRLDAELVGNVSIRVLPTERPDAWEVQGRGELQLAVLVETMRREGYELTVGKPEVVTREVDGKLHEPVERVVIDVPEEYLGAVTQLLALRKGRMEQMVNHGTGWVRLEYLVPARGLIGFRTEFLTETRGTGHPAPRVRRLRAVVRRASAAAPNGVDGRRPARRHHGLRARSTSRSAASCFVGPGVEVYEGMIVGENARAEDMDVNVDREKKLTNMRAVGLGRHRAPHPAAADVARAGARVHRRRRVRRGHAAQRAPAQGDPRRLAARPPPQLQEAATRLTCVAP